MERNNSHTSHLFRFAREYLGLSVRALAQQLKISPSNLSRIESGKISPKKEVVEALVRLTESTNLETLFIMAYR